MVSAVQGASDDLALAAWRVATLPRVRRGIDPSAVEELVRRAAHELRQRDGDNLALRQTLSVLTARAEELEALVQALQDRLAAQKAPTDAAQALLGAARRKAQEQRESARRDGELVLREARRRAARLEQTAHERVAASVREVAELESLRAELAAQLHGAIESIAALRETHDERTRSAPVD
jgi:hypothetical protein